MGYILTGAFFVYVFADDIPDAWNGLQSGDISSLIWLAVFGMIAYWCLGKAVEKEKTLPRPLQFLGWFFVAGGVCYFISNLGDFEDICFSIGCVVMGLCIVYFARLRKKPEKKVSQPPVLTADKSAATLPKAEEGLSSLIRKVWACPGARSNPAFRSLLTEISGLYEDLSAKGVHIPQTLTEHLTKLLEAYLDLDDDPVKTDTTFKMQNQIEDGIATIHDALKKLYDKYLSASQMDLESDITAVEMKLRQDGLLDSDFQMNRDE